MRWVPDLSWLIFVPWYWVLGGCVALAVIVGLTLNAIQEHRARQAWLDNTREVMATETRKFIDVFDQMADSAMSWAPCTSCGVADESCSPPAFCCVVCRYATRTHPVVLRKDTP